MLEIAGTIEKYYVAVRPQTNEVHPVHREGCPFMPDDEKRIYLGSFISGNEAGMEGRKYYANSHGCRFCAKESFKERTRQDNNTFSPSEKSMLKFLN